GRRGNRTDLLSAVVLDDTRETFRRRRERRLPLHFLPHAILPHERAHEAVFAVDALIAEAVAAGDPRFVNVLVRTRHDAHDPPAQHVRVDVRADAIVRRDERMLRHLPRTRAVAVRLVVQRTDRAEVDDVRRQLVLHGALDERADLGHLAATDRAELLEALNLLREAHAARAVNEARHVGGDQRSQVLVFDDALALGV